MPSHWKSRTSHCTTGQPQRSQAGGSLRTHPKQAWVHHAMALKGCLPQRGALVWWLFRDFWCKAVQQSHFRTSWGQNQTSFQVPKGPSLKNGLGLALKASHTV